MKKLPLVIAAVFSSLSLTAGVIQQIDPNFVSIPAEAVDSIDDVDKPGSVWKIVTNGNLTTQGIGFVKTDSVLAGAYGTGGVFAENDFNQAGSGTFPNNSNNSNLNYKIQFSSPGTYHFYFRATNFDRNPVGGAINGGASDSYWLAPAFGDAIPGTDGVQQLGGVNSTGYNGNPWQPGLLLWYNVTTGQIYEPGLATFNGKWSFNVTEGMVGQETTFRLGMRESALLFDHLVFSKQFNLTEAQLNAIPEPSVYGLGAALTAFGFLLYRRRR